jgi:hypothetical protein
MNANCLSFPNASFSIPHPIISYSSLPLPGSWIEILKQIHISKWDEISAICSSWARLGLELEPWKEFYNLFVMETENWTYILYALEIMHKELCATGNNSKDMWCYI